jgi:Beta-propeller domains of methanol dehydrogenase type
MTARESFAAPLLAVVLAAVVTLLSAPPALALDVPVLAGRINDTAGILAPHTISLLDHSLQSLEEHESTQIVVLTIPSLKGDSVEGYALRVAEQWQIGQKGLDNGALLLVAVKGRKSASRSATAWKAP